MKILLLLIALFFTGCGAASQTEYTDIYVFGKSQQRDIYASPLEVESATTLKIHFTILKTKEDVTATVSTKIYNQLEKSKFYKVKLHVKNAGTFFYKSPFWDVEILEVVNEISMEDWLNENTSIR